MPKLLIVSPHFPPSNAADMHRVRSVLPFMRENGWQAEVLSVAPECCAVPQDAWLLDGVPKDVLVHRTRALGLQWSRLPGFGTLDLRCLRSLRKAGDRILGSRSFDLVYFSTTVFGVHQLGRHWRRRFDVPFAMDYQDPWVSDYYQQHSEVIPPGGRLKFAIVDRLNRWMEPRVLRHCAGITSVSPDYPRQLFERYDFLREKANWPVQVLPFPGNPHDLDRVQESPVAQDVFQPRTKTQNWVYVGRGGSDLSFALRSFFRALAKHIEKHTQFATQIRLHFLGTSYAAAGRGEKSIEPIAGEFGVSEVVEESPDRIPYAQTLRCLLDADALIVPGSDDPGYTASKIYPYLLARKPMLAVFQEESSVVQLIGKVGGAVVVPFAASEADTSVSARIEEAWFASEAWRKPVPLDNETFAPHAAKSQAHTLARFFDRCIQ